jgi:hypothetical protein
MRSTSIVNPLSACGAVDEHPVEKQFAINTAGIVQVAGKPSVSHR